MATRTDMTLSNSNDDINQMVASRSEALRIVFYVQLCNPIAFQKLFYCQLGQWYELNAKPDWQC